MCAATGRRRVNILSERRASVSIHKRLENRANVPFLFFDNPVGTKKVSNDGIMLEDDRFP